MKKIYLWLKKHLKCIHEGHDYGYVDYIGGGYFICKRCGHVSKFATWAKEDNNGNE